jgi:hypothetical protein
MLKLEMRGDFGGQGAIEGLGLLALGRRRSSLSVALTAAEGVSPGSVAREQVAFFPRAA